MTHIRFHIGAHKTATTHQQMTLARSHFVPGTRFVPLKLLRRCLTSPVRRGRPHLPWYRWHQGTWLFSDENMLGNTANALNLYPAGAPALRHFLDQDLHVFLCVRSYDTFLASAYGECLWRHPYRPFPEAPPMRGWHDLVADLQQQLPGVPISVWQYEHYRLYQQEILQFFSGNRIEQFGQSRQSAPKSAFSARAVDEMAQFSQRRPRRRAVEQIRRQYPAGDQYPVFNPWTAGQREQLQLRYQQDLARLATMVPMWQPQAPN